MQSEEQERLSKLSYKERLRIRDEWLWNEAGAVAETVMKYYNDRKKEKKNEQV